ncbi:MAG TPA: hypothetical protein VNO81_11790, partial [Candidatus Nitrosotenuis sp.]|nr:hypothetical protein [Candidatus Nitrosotenuis sp.]
MRAHIPGNTGRAGSFPLEARQPPGAARGSPDPVLADARPLELRQRLQSHLEAVVTGASPGPTEDLALALRQRLEAWRMERQERPQARGPGPDRGP